MRKPTVIAHDFHMDALGRMFDERVQATGGVDGAVRDLGYAFDAAGNPTLFTSYGLTGNVLNQVQRTYNGFAQVTAELQNNTGLVTAAGTLTTGHTYTSAATGSLESMLTYPDGRVETYSHDSPIGQVTGITDSPTIANPGGQVLETYQYLGVNTILNRTRPLSTSSGPGGTTTTQITGATTPDNFGRVGAIDWSLSTTAGNGMGGSVTELDQYLYGYNLDGAVASRGNQLNAAFSETYGLDDLNRMTNFARGGQTLASWDLDSQGNKYNGPYGGSYNAWNKIITSPADNNLDTLTSVILTPAWDTSNLQSASVTYNSWNEVVGTLATNDNTIPNPKNGYDYDALGRLIDVRTINSSGTTLTARYLYDGGNVIEERDQNGNVTTQYVWAPDGMLILRDRDADGNAATADNRIPNASYTGLDERLYALTDAGGSITAVTDIAGNVQERYVYNQDGSPTILDANWNPYPATQQSGGAWSPYNWQYLFHGMRWEPMDYLTSTGTRAVTGLYQSNGGWYNPRQGVSMQPDPMAYLAGRNAYDVTGMGIGNNVAIMGIIGASWLLGPEIGLPVTAFMTGYNRSRMVRAQGRSSWVVWEMRPVLEPYLAG